MRGMHRQLSDCGTQLSNGARVLRLTFDTYVVLDIEPDDWVGEVMALRRRHDLLRAEYPVEITLVGSSGVGCVAPENGVQRAIDVISALVAETPPFEVRFADVRRFPETNIYWLAPEPEPLIALHRQIAGSGLTFRSVPFAFTPHCTLVDLGAEPDAAAQADVQGFPVPTSPVRFRTASVYMIDARRRPIRTHTFALGTGRRCQGGAERHSF